MVCAVRHLAYFMRRSRVPSESRTQSNFLFYIDAVLVTAPQTGEFLHFLSSPVVHGAEESLIALFANEMQTSTMPASLDLQAVQTMLLHIPSGLVIADMIIALGCSLGIDVVVEGIESEQDLQFWQQHGCHHAQGFHLDRPMLADQFVDWYRRHAASLH